MRLSRSGRAGHAVALFAQNFFERGANLRFVVDHQDVVHEARPFRPSRCCSLAATRAARTGSISGKRSRKRAPLGLLALGADGAAVLLHDFGGDGKAQAGAAMLGGVEGQEQPLANLVGQAVAGVGDGDLNGRAIFAERGANAEHAQQAALHGFGGIVDQVGQRAANGLGIGQHRAASRAPDRAAR